MVKQDDLSIDDVLYKNIIINKSDVGTLVDSVVNKINLSRNDTIVLTDIIYKEISINKTDAISLSDLINIIGQYFGILKTYNGSAWVKAKLKTYDGSFTEKRTRAWTGVEWKDIDATGI